jgi:hypothetical protein
VSLFAAIVTDIDLEGVARFGDDLADGETSGEVDLVRSRAEQDGAATPDERSLPRQAEPGLAIHVEHELDGAVRHHGYQQSHAGREVVLPATLGRDAARTEIEVPSRVPLRLVEDDLGPTKVRHDLLPRSHLINTF